MSGELTQFEQKSALTPKQMPYAIIGGCILAFIVVLLVTAFGKNEAVNDLHQMGKENAAQATAPAATSGSAGSIDDI